MREEHKDKRDSLSLATGLLNPRSETPHLLGTGAHILNLCSSRIVGMAFVREQGRDKHSEIHMNFSLTQFLMNFTISVG